MKQLRESVRRLKRGRKEDIVLVRRWFPQFCFHNMRCVRKLAAYASDAKADVIRYSPVRDVCECHSLFCYCIFRIDFDAGQPEVRIVFGGWILLDMNSFCVREVFGIKCMYCPAACDILFENSHLTSTYTGANIG